MNPRDAVIAVTYRCNCACSVCNIWKSRSVEDLPVECGDALPPGLANIGITGGEPTLHGRLDELVGRIRRRCPGAKLTLSTNGLDGERRAGLFRALHGIDRNIGIAVSIDGPAQVHDRIRGVPGAFGQAVRTLEMLRGIGFGDLRVSFTAGDENVDRMRFVFLLARRLGAAFTCGVVHNSPNYFRKEDNRFSRLDLLKRNLDFVIRAHLRSPRPKEWFMAYYLRGLYHAQAAGRRLLPCGALRDFFFLDPGGRVYPCIFRPEAVGLLKPGSSFGGVWNAPEVAQLRAGIRDCRIPCWQLCTVRTSILGHLPAAALWAAASRLRMMRGGRTL